MNSVRSIQIHGSVNLSTGLLRFLNENGIALYLFDRYGKYSGSFDEKERAIKAAVTMAEVEVYRDPVKRLRIARELEHKYLASMCDVLKSYKRHHQEGAIKDVLQELRRCDSKIDQAISVDQLLLQEASVRELYYQALSKMLRNQAFAFNGRNRRPPMDPTNAMMSYGNAVLYRRLAEYIYEQGLDIRFGFVHATNRRAETLNLDLADIYKPLLVDRVVINLINRNMIDAALHFQEAEENAIILNAAGKQIYMAALDRELFRQRKEGSYASRMKREIHMLKQTIMNMVEDREELCL